MTRKPPALIPGLVKTDSVLGARYLSGKRPTLTHAVDVRTGNSLCGRIRAEGFAGDPSVQNEKPTCSRCSDLDPRAPWTPKAPAPAVEIQSDLLAKAIRAVVAKALEGSFEVSEPVQDGHGWNFIVRAAGGNARRVIVTSL